MRRCRKLSNANFGPLKIPAEMRIVESAEQLVRPQRRFDAVAIGA
jgi:hypothetical protein